MANNVQEQRPVRSEGVMPRTKHQAYKDELRVDFRRRCGYCDDKDVYSGGKRGFHIDHFKPKSKFDDLKTTYSNLVYSCPYCNIAKSNKWKPRVGFIDPCSAEYENHLLRDERGRIVPKTKRGAYIHKELKLGLRRHEILWMMGRLKSQKTEIKAAIDAASTTETELRLLRVFLDIQNRIDSYFSDFEAGG